MWRIWIKYFDEDGKRLSVGVYPKTYKRKYSAVRRATKLWGPQGEDKRFEWIVSETNPFVEERGE